MAGAGTRGRQVSRTPVRGSRFVWDALLSCCPRESRSNVSPTMKQVNRHSVSLLGILLLLTALSVTLAQSDGPATQGVGLIRNDPGAYPGYTLLSPLQSTSTYLIDMNGKVVKTWNAGSTPSSIAYLLENGNLIRAGAQPNSPYGAGVAGGGGKIQEFNWNGTSPIRVRRCCRTTTLRGCPTATSCWWFRSGKPQRRRSLPGAYPPPWKVRRFTRMP
jgi:hypothetical protein